MSAKVIFVFCAQALFVQLAFSSCIGRPNLGACRPSCGSCTPLPPRGGCGCTGPVPQTQLAFSSCIGRPNLGACRPSCGSCTPLPPRGGCGCTGPVPQTPGCSGIPTSGGSFIVTSCSPIAPTGLSIVSENVFEGTLCVVGELPFVSTVTVEGEVPSGGTGAVNHSCGDDSDAASILPSGIGAFGPGAGPLSLLPGGCYEIVSPVCGCGKPGICC